MGAGSAQVGVSEIAAAEHLCLSLPPPGWAQLDGTLDPLSSTATAYQEVRQRVHGRVLPKNNHKPLEGSAVKGKVLCVVRLVFNDAGNKLFWRCPWCPFSRDAPSSMHTHFERRHPGLLEGIAKVAYLRPCADREGRVRAFLSGPTIGSFTNPRPLGPFPTGQPSLCSSSRDEACAAPSPRKHHGSPSQPASKKQRLDQSEIGASKLSAARHPQISPQGKQAAQSVQETDPQESLHGLHSPVRSRDAVRADLEVPGQAHGRVEHSKQPQTGSNTQRHAQPELETTMLPGSQSLGLSSHIHGHFLPRDLRLPFQAAPPLGLGLRLVDHGYQGLMSAPSPSLASLEDRHNSSSSSQMPGPMLSTAPAPPGMDNLRHYDRLGKFHSRLSDHHADTSLPRATTDLLSIPQRPPNASQNASQAEGHPHALADLSSGTQPQQTVPQTLKPHALSSPQLADGSTPTAVTGSEVGRLEEQGPLPPSCVGSLLEVLQGIQNLPSGLRPHRIDVSFRTGVLSVYPNDSPA